MPDSFSSDSNPPQARSVKNPRGAKPKRPTIEQALKKSMKFEQPDLSKILEQNQLMEEPNSRNMQCPVSKTSSKVNTKKTKSFDMQGGDYPQQP
mmetsp:Transcript_37509/g.57464  ORF Transcript_37509/g.57464 Transcript_37509/m.57464 type:complete len:94 (+) Transcript_37509:3021-3302(+)